MQTELLIVLVIAMSCTSVCSDLRASIYERYPVSVSGLFIDTICIGYIEFEVVNYIGHTMLWIVEIVTTTHIVCGLCHTNVPTFIFLEVFISSFFVVLSVLLIFLVGTSLPLARLYWYVWACSSWTFLPTNTLQSVHRHLALSMWQSELHPLWG